MSSAAAETRYTQEQYLNLERAAACKSEYVNGRIYALAGASRAHNLLSANLVREVSLQLKGRPCEVYAGDMRVKFSPTGLYTYPDLVAVCGEPVFEDTHLDTLLNPTVIIEILSPSTEAEDRGDKFAHYRRLPSLQEYVLVAQNKVRVERFVRQGEEWVLTEISDMNAMLPLAAIGCEVALREMYDKVTLPDNATGL